VKSIAINHAIQVWARGTKTTELFF